MQSHDVMALYRAGALAIAVQLACAVTTSAAAPLVPHVVQFTPQRTVKQVRQVTARFSEPMVPLGDPRSTVDPFAIDCTEKGTARWIDSRNWAYDFKRDVPGGVRCTFRLRAGLKTVKGTAVGGTRTFTFSTGGPAVRRSEPFEGNESIEEDQAFVLSLDAEPTEASVLAHAWFRVAGIQERVGVRLVTGAARDAILKTFWRGALNGPIIVLQSRQRFPNDAKVSLVWGTGIAAASGVATERDQVLSFTTRKAFTAQFYCQRENARTDCIPLTAMSVSFSAPVKWEQASQIRLTGADGKRWVAEARTDEPKTPDLFVSRVDFKGPFPESATFRVELPPDLHDEAGRSLVNASEYPLTVRTASLPPLAKFSSRFGIIESKAGEPVLPVTLRNLEPEVAGNIGTVTGTLTRIPPERFDEIMPWLRKVNLARRMASVFRADKPLRSATPGAQPTALPALPVKSFALPKPNGAKAFEVVGIPLGAPGLYVVELSSPRLGAALLGKEQPMYVPTAALVTNLSVHFKWGDENSLVWVTTLEDAQPVSGAHVAIQDCEGKVIWKGDTDAQGIARATGLPARDALPRC
ncbi:MAG TPA: alpha-2-macroglobulin, partial [Candidatus Margulisiibacteriota bacterium]|nr:alpha-2-macroglobulin [Candidatus Margulisiibacteriota bacterium]